MRLVWQRPEPSQATDVASGTLHTRQVLRGSLPSPAFRSSNFRHQAPGGESWNYMGEKYGREFCLNFRFPRNIQGSFTCRKVRHGTDGFTSPPKEDVLRIFFRPKNPTASAGFEPTNLGSTLTSRP